MPMTWLLEKAFAEASKLPEDQQEAIAAIVLDELASERRWSEAFAKSQDQLASPGNEALAEFKEGRTRLFEKDSDLTHD